MGQVPCEIVNLHKQCESYVIILRKKIIIGRHGPSAIAPEVLLAALLVGFDIQNFIFTNNYTRAYTLYCHFSLSP